MSHHISKGKDRTWIAHIIPHSHIDIEWYWNLEETIFRATKIIKEAIKILSKNPDFHFCQDQALILKYVLKNLDEKEKESLMNAIKRGSFEIVGGMWVQSDCQIPNGEVLVRQILNGLKFIKKEFQKDVKCAWNIDVFGQCPQLPQILKKFDYKYLVFWRGVKEDLAQELPSEFFWESPDGSKILTHWMPLGYGPMALHTNFLHPIDAHLNICALDLTFPSKWYIRYAKIKDLLDLYLMKASTKNILIPYGTDMFVPHEGMLQNIKILNDEFNGKYVFKFSTPSNFFKEIEKEQNKLKTFTYDFNLPLREMDLRGTWDSRPKLKEHHRKMECTLLSAEKVASLAMLLGMKYPKEALREAWEHLLLNCFHDIIGGSHTDDVYISALRRYEYVKNRAEKVVQDALNKICEEINTSNGKEPIVVFNTLSWKRTDICIVKMRFREGEVREFLIQDWRGEEIPFQIIEGKKYSDGSFKSCKIAFLATDVPPLGYKLYYLNPGPARNPSNGYLKVTENMLENKHFRVEFDRDSGVITKLVQKELGVNTLDTSEWFGNELIADAHEGDLEGTLNLSGLTWRAKDYKCYEVKIKNGPIFAQLEYVGNFKDSERRNIVTLYESLQRIDFKTHINLKKPQLFIRTRFPSSLKNYDVWHETPYAPIKRNDGHYAAQTCAWIEGKDHGLSLINKGNPGYWVKNGNLDLILLWSVEQYRPKHLYDAPLAKELGEHIFQYSLYPYKGSWREAKVIHMGHEVNNPLIAVQVTSHKGTLPGELSFIKCNSENFILTAIKEAENSKGLVIRGCELYGVNTKLRLRTFKKFKKAYMTDLKEDILSEIKMNEGEFTLTCKPYEIITLYLEM